MLGERCRSQASASCIGVAPIAAAAESSTDDCRGLSLLFAVFEDHLDKVSRAVEVACEDACHKPMSEMIRRVVEAYVDAKMQHADISVALYKVAPDVGGPALVKQTG